ncbi:hypothetical protein F5Y16DRAFT_392062 [Xylariaceae sp. FL0255]|nr:hypothetical protein F5Y16DRAFT_392062 [Xylariaceae sp. FL0255]
MAPLWNRVIRLRLLRLVIGFIFVVVLVSRQIIAPLLFSYTPGLLFKEDLMNNTLGFERILAVSKGPSWRSEGLLDAANLTGLDIHIPPQPDWSIEEVEAFRVKSAGSDRISFGSTKCWLGHINVLSHIVSQNWSSVLILEDDVDWDIAIRRQLALVAPAIRAITHATRHGHWSYQPYGNTWDLLWLGHCGDYAPPNSIALFDASLPLSPRYREVDGRYSVWGKPQIRLVHTTAMPLCAFAYALTGSAAKKIFLSAKDGVERIITTDLKRWCSTGFLRCVTVNPELFHHHKKAGMATSEIALASGWEYNVWTVDFTPNIRYSARCNSKSTELVTCMDEFGDEKEKSTT